MKNDTISLRRRHVVIAALAGVAAPAMVFAAQDSSMPGVAFASQLSTGMGAGEHKLVVSGRILRPDGKPLADARVEVWHAGVGGNPLNTTTDADGRFVFTTTAVAGYAGLPRYLNCRVSDQGHDRLVTELRFARGQGGASDRVAQLQRDDAGIWRASFGLTLA